MKLRPAILAFGVVALAATSLSAQSNWPQFRGKTGGVVADDPALPETWGSDENII